MSLAFTSPPETHRVSPTHPHTAKHTLKINTKCTHRRHKAPAPHSNDPSGQHGAWECSLRCPWHSRHRLKRTECHQHTLTLRNTHSKSTQNVLTAVTKRLHHIQMTPAGSMVHGSVAPPVPDIDVPACTVYTTNTCSDTPLTAALHCCVVLHSPAASSEFTSSMRPSPAARCSGVTPETRKAIVKTH